MARRSSSTPTRPGRGWRRASPPPACGSSTCRAAPACPSSTPVPSAPATSSRTSSTMATSRRPRRGSPATTRPSSSSAPSPGCRWPTRSASASDCPATAAPRAPRAAGLRTAEALKTAEASAAVAWAAERGSAPVVVKPLDSAGTDGVSICHDPAAIEAAFAANLGRPNALHGANEELLVQELLEGTQLFVNSISWDGAHHVSEVWRDNKLRAGANFIYDYEELLPRHGSQQDQVVPYVEAVLDALGIRFGPAPTEVMLTATGPVLVESGARMHGSVPDEIVDRCTPSHQTLTAEAYLDPKSVARRAQQPYELAAGAYCVMLISQHEGRIVDDAGMREIEALPSFAGTISMLGPGDQLKRTVDLFSCPGIIYLVDPDRDRLKADYDRIRELDASGAVFELEQLVVS